MASKKLPQVKDTSSPALAADFQVGQAAVVLMLKAELANPLEAEVISPDVLGELENAEIRALPVLLGNRPHRLGDFFEVEGEKSTHLELYGNLERVKWIGRGMTRGSIVARGNAGMHLGSGMAGGSITVYGDTSDWLGAEMSGGQIRVHGRAGGQVGGAYRRSPVGMRGGEILIDRTAGLEVGRRMRGGLISIQERVGDFAGVEMKGGTLVMFGGVGIRAGAWMSAGTIVAFQPLPLLPTFLKASPVTSETIRVPLERLQELGVPVPEQAWKRLYQRFLGDTSEDGHGEILICDSSAIEDTAPGRPFCN
jgi:formylmethanofuran dehydrogenase subunit C